MCPVNTIYYRELTKLSFRLVYIQHYWGLQKYDNSTVVMYYYVCSNDRTNRTWYMIDYTCQATSTNEGVCGKRGHALFWIFSFQKKWNSI